jgi:hypothetical protein
MKLDKLTSQLDGNRKQGLEAVFGNAPDPEQPPAPAPRSRRPAAASKRTSWKMRAWYVRPETAKRLAAYVNRQQEAGAKLDASDVVDQAISAWLDKTNC